ncbi:hypothetical protein GP486_004361, partial [Trichoglossum hirsutum]
IFTRFSNDIARFWESGVLEEEDSSTGSSINLELAKAWHDECKKNHPRCQLSSTSLPTRVIDIGEESSNPTLYETMTGESAEYVALSHCWGTDSPIEPGEEKRDSRRIELPPLHQWPQTFRDAVNVARAFAIRYLWIDNICIRQGDKGEDDWKVESLRMSDYFKNATFTIASTKAADGSEGCFSHRSPLLTRPCRIQLISETSSENISPLELWVCPNPTLKDFQGYDGPLSWRCWTLQEELLSRRILFFWKTQLAWTCLTSNASESYPDPTSIEQAPKDAVGFNFRLSMHVPIIPDDLAQRSPYYDFWCRLIESFTERNMTYQRDTLPAISALAITMNKSLAVPDRYVAGLWMRDLTVGLLWAVDRESKGRRPVPPGQKNYLHEGFSAPSWSWVSMSHCVVKFLRAKEILPGGWRNRYTATTDPQDYGPQILCVHINSSNTYGRVIDGTLRVRAKLSIIRINLHPSRRGNRLADFEHPNSNGLTWKLTMDYVNFIERRVLKRELITGDCELDGGDTSMLSSYVQGEQILAYFLPLLAYATDEGEWGRWVGLALVQRGEANEYTRIGRVAINLHSTAYILCDLPDQDISIR